MTDTEKRIPVKESALPLAGVAPDWVATQTLPEAFTASQVGMRMTSDHRYYMNGIGPKPSVTTVLDILNKPALMIWKAKEVAKAIFRNSKGFFGEGWEKGEDEAVLWALRESDKARDTAAKLGTGVHYLANLTGASEKAVEGFQVSDEEMPYVNAFRAFLRFLEAHSGSIVSSEHAVWNLNGYAGTYDLICQIDGELWLIDIKTGKSATYPEYGLQLAAYRWGENIILPGDPNLYPMPEIQRTGILHLRPDQYADTGWRLVEFPTTTRDYIAFLAALELYQWKAEGRFTRSILKASTKG